MSSNNDKSESKGFGVFASSRIVFGVVIAVGCLWLGATVISFFTGTPEEKSPYSQAVDNYPTLKKADGLIEDFLENKQVNIKKENQVNIKNEDIVADNLAVSHGGDVQKTPGDTSHVSGSSVNETSTPMGDTEAHSSETTADVVHKEPAPAQSKDPHGGGSDYAGATRRSVIGIAFVDSMTSTLEAELEHRFWGWRPNDVFTFFMDNVENYQLGVWDINRRTAVILAERIARTGSNVSFNEHLNSAVNSLTVKPDSLFWPSAEGEYKKAVKNLKKYRQELLEGKETFYTRPDNLIPLLIEFRTRLGHSDNELVNHYAGSHGGGHASVSTFEADDRFYYAKGVASTILPILIAVEEDFYTTLNTRGGLESLENAINACKGAAEMSPWVVTEGDYNGVLANHRANMATYISHARFYLGVLITILST